ncbi:MAG TPA: hypothetical protein VH257_23590, partial [Chloroflexota bacterium]|nr:hypothetical protein [Chloroflexota bacterium]
SLIYEAIGVEQSASGRLQPITSYVRCAIHLDKVGHTGGLWTGFTFFVAGFLVGHWLWARPVTAIEKTGATRRQPTPDVPRDWVPYLLMIAGLVLVGCVLGIVLSERSVPFPFDGSSGAGALAQEAGASGTYAVGMSIVIVTVFLILIGITGLDLYFELRQWEPVGLRVQQWSLENRWYVGALLVVLGALVAHFLGHPVTRVR